MSSIRTIEGDFTATGARIALVATRFNHFIVDSLVAGAVDCLTRHGVREAQMDLIKVPGAFELPLVVKRVAASKNYDAVIALGAVIRGGTAHFEYVAGECAKGIAQVAMSESIPVTFGVITVDSIEQAIERAGTKAGNKGADAAMAALEMISLLKRLED